MAEKDYSNRELNEKFNRVADTSTRNMEEITDLIRRNDKDYRDSFATILEQTTQHNHRMDKIEKVMLVLGTAVVILIALKVPAIAGLFALNL